MLAQHSFRLNSQVSGIRLLGDASAQASWNVRQGDRAKKFANEEI
jgi:hypothetical protein